MQYTIRDVPSVLDRALRKRVRETGSSLNQIVLDVLLRGVGIDAQSVPKRDLSDLCGRMQADDAFDAAIRDQEKVDAGLWG